MDDRTATDAVDSGHDALLEFVAIWGDNLSARLKTLFRRSALHVPEPLIQAPSGPNVVPPTQFPTAASP
jgi:hypothetical protein